MLQLDTASLKNRLGTYSPRIPSEAHHSSRVELEALSRMVAMTCVATSQPESVADMLGGI